MSRPAPSFPAFEDWKRMSEREQDALLDRLETEKRRGAFRARLLLVLGCATVVLAAGFVFLALR
jgi:CHASE3 domain sensor protein